MKDYKEAIESIMKDTTSKVMDHAIKAYRQGYENGLGKAQTDSYVKGYEDGQKEKLANAMIHDHEVAEKTAYEDGMNAAWEAVRKLYEMPIDDYSELFDTKSPYFDFSAQEAIAKIKEYEDKQKQDDWRDIPSDEMTLDQARRAVKELRSEVLKEMRGRVLFPV